MADFTKGTWGIPGILKWDLDWLVGCLKQQNYACPVIWGRKSFSWKILKSCQCWRAGEPPGPLTKTHKMLEAEFWLMITFYRPLPWGGYSSLLCKSWRRKTWNSMNCAATAEEYWPLNREGVWLGVARTSTPYTLCWSSGTSGTQGTLHYLQNETSFKSLAGHQGDRGGDVAGVDTDHVGMFIVTKIRHFLDFLVPGVPDDRVW